MNNKFESFKELLQPASFKGIEFEVTNFKSDFGHRHATNAFPFVDQFEIQKFGKKQAGYKITGFLLGKNYITKINELKKAIEEGKDGELIHPSLGRLVVFCQTFSVSENNDKKGICTIEFEFIESSKILPITTKINKAELVDAASNKTKNNSINAFIEAYNFAKDSVKEISNQILQAQLAINESINAVRDVENFAGSVTQIATDFTYLIKNAQNLVDRVAAFPELVGNLLNGVMESFNKVLSNDKSGKNLSTAISSLVFPSMFADKEDKKNSLTNQEKSYESKKILNSFKEIYSKELINKRDILNVNEVQKLMQTHVLASACTYASSSATFLNINEANSTRDELIKKIDALMDDENIDDDVFNSLYELRVSTYDALSSIANEIPIIKIYNNEDYNNLIIFCFENFDTVENIDSIISLNNIENPLFIEGFLNIKVIEDDKIKS